MKDEKIMSAWMFFEQISPQPELDLVGRVTGLPVD